MDSWIVEVGNEEKKWKKKRDRRVGEVEVEAEKKWRDQVQCVAKWSRTDKKHRPPGRWLGDGEGGDDGALSYFPKVTMIRPGNSAGWLLLFTYSVCQ